MNVIYEPSGKAKEYADLAANLYKGCTHGCRYCFGAKTPWVSADDYYKTANPKKDVISKLQMDCRKLNGDAPEILLSFVGDVYQHAEMDLGLTRQAIKILIENDLPFTVLTKGGTRAVRDFDLLEGYDKARFGTTLVFADIENTNHWEPGAASFQDRLNAIVDAHDRAIKTWVSLEPVIDPGVALWIIKELHPIVDHWKIGKINHWPGIDVDWIGFREDVRALLDDLGADYYLKKSLTELRG